MKVLYVNPVFLDYRIPFYKRLNDLFHGNFRVLYSPNRYRSHKFETTLEKIERILDGIAIPHQMDFVFYTASMSFKYNPVSRQIPIPIGLLCHLIKIRPSVVISEGFLQWTPWSMLYCLLFRKDLYIAYERTIHTERKTPKWMVWHRKLSDRFVKGYFANGTETKKYLLSIGIDASKIYIGGMCADSQLPANINKMDFKEKKNLYEKYHEKEGLTYLYVGRVEHAKGVDYLMDGWKEHYKNNPNDRLLLVGDGELLKTCQQYVEYGILALGRVPYDEIYKYFAIADVFVIATLQDNWSLVVPEAMICGLPVAVSIYNGCYTDLVREGVNGFCFDPYEKDDIVKTLSKFHNNDLKAMGTMSKMIEKDFNIFNSTQRIFDAITKH